MSQQYPQWIDEYARAFHKVVLNSVPGEWGPVDYYALWALLNGLFIERVHEAVQRAKKHGFPIEKAAKTFFSPTQIRLALHFILCEYALTEPKNKEACKEAAEYMVELLSFTMEEDTFAYERNIVHKKEEIQQILEETAWKPGSPRAAQALGKLYTTLFSMANAVHGDFYAQNSLEVYGPYDVSLRFGENAILQEKHINFAGAQKLWLNLAGLKYLDVKMFQVYRNVSFKCTYMGLHSQYEGDIANGLVSWGVFVDGKEVESLEEIKELTSYFSKTSTEQSLIYNGMTREERKIKALEWECFQFMKFFELAGMDWRPTPPMLAAVRDKEVKDRVVWETLLSFEEYIASPEYEVYWLKDLYT